MARNYRKILEYILKEKQKQKQLRDYLALCPFAVGCAESDYGDEEICTTDYESCKRHKSFKKENISKYLEKIK